MTGTDRTERLDSEDQALEPIRSIVAAADFSANSAEAVRHAIGLAGARGAALHVVHAVDALTIPHPPIELQRLIRTRLDAIGAEVAAAGVTGTSEFRTGAPWDVIVEVARKHAADLVVIGAHGRSIELSPGSWLRIGRTADRIIRLSESPVLTIPPGPAVAAEPRIGRILVGMDFSPGAMAALHVARRLAGRDVPPAYTFVNAWQPIVDYEPGPVGGIPMVIDDLGAASGEHLEEVAAQFRRAGLDVSTSFRQGFPSDEILKAAEETRADLIALGTHGHTGLAHMLLGSVAERVVHRAKAPVLTVGLRVKVTPSAQHG